MTNRDTQLCMSPTGRPGNFGIRFHNYLYEGLRLNSIYEIFTTQDTEAAIEGAHALGIRGCTVSMPFKESCMPFLDAIDPFTKVVDSVNTIVNDNDALTGSNTDYIAVKGLTTSHQLDNYVRVMTRGSGGTDRAVIAAFRDAGFRDVIITTRSRGSGPILAKQYSFQWQPQSGGVIYDILVNVIPVDMTGSKESDELVYSEATVAVVSVVFDVVVPSSETPIIKLTQQLGKETISGAEVIVLQAVEQFVIYTDVRPDDALIIEAAEFTRVGWRSRKRAPRMDALSILGTMQQRTVAGQLSFPTAPVRESIS